ncbi:MAG: hypothetical protein NVS3B20_24460 [Polyangiales bacterium]
MIRDLGGFTTAADRRHARTVGFTSGVVVFAIGAAVSLRLAHFYLFAASIVAGLIASALHRRFALSRTPKGVIDLEDDARLGVVLSLRRREHTLHRVPLKHAKFIGRTRKLGVGPVRLQIEVRWDESSLVAALAIPFRGAIFDVDGVLPSAIDLDRTASRAFDALSYEVAADAAEESNGDAAK